MARTQNRDNSSRRARHLLALSIIASCTAGCATRRPKSTWGTHAVLPPAVTHAGPETSGTIALEHSSEEASDLRSVGYEDVQMVNRSDRDAAVLDAPETPTQLDLNEEATAKPFNRLLAIDFDNGNQRDRDESDGELVQPGDRPGLGTADSLAPARSYTSQPVGYFVQQALATHPSIQAARQRVYAEQDRIPQVTALPDPQFNNTFWPLENNATQTAAGRVANQMSLQQGVPFPDKLRTRGAIVSREAQMAQAELERIERQVTESVRLAYYEVWYATRAMQVIEQTRELVDDLNRVAEARYRAGGTQQDVLRAQLEIDRLDDQLIQLRRQKEVSQADLAALMQQPIALMAEATEELDIADAPIQLAALIAQAEHCNPSLRGLAAEIQRDRQQQKLACLQQYPDFMVGLNWGIVSDNHDVLSPVANGNDQLSLTFGTTLPIWREKIDAGIREASRRTSSTQQRLEAERNEIYGRLRRLLSQADALVEQDELYRTRLVPRTEDTLRLAVADYRGERTDFYTLIETYRELLMFETQLARIHATLAGTIAQIDRTVGCPY
ncbi:Outer membrane efflux protein [Allorhodopirellula heiligendammensis]|uniref:Outer membrane efflux protein n=1 Tax=Allorhodopirellula heiligendammensis TaxID=2714739 RepID=A0A5C6BWI6_9BACT|nr:TolC family protein [Allorhodopirellula heiligendammensis]TWU15144.1 Outer membrane efflux protein [Allorhodopirellula heiligendammensis]